MRKPLSGGTGVATTISGPLWHPAKFRHKIAVNSNRITQYHPDTRVTACVSTAMNRRRAGLLTADTYVLRSSTDKVIVVTRFDSLGYPDNCSASAENSSMNCEANRIAYLPWKVPFPAPKILLLNLNPACSSRSMNLGRKPEGCSVPPPSVLGPIVF